MTSFLKVLHISEMVGHRVSVGLLYGHSKDSLGQYFSGGRQRGRQRYDWPNDG